MKKGQIQLIVIIIVLIGIFFLVASAKETPINNPSQCYSTLQPSRFFSSSPIYGNGYIRIEISNRQFYLSQTANTGSMRPAISDYSDLILIKPQIDDIKVGDAINFNCNNKLILHRVIAINNGIYTTKGDNNAIPDDCKTTFDLIEGKLVGVLY